MAASIKSIKNVIFSLVLVIVAVAAAAATSVFLEEAKCVAVGIKAVDANRTVLVFFDKTDEAGGHIQILNMTIEDAVKMVTTELQENATKPVRIENGSRGFDVLIYACIRR